MKRGLLERKTAKRRDVLRSLAALPVAGLLWRPGRAGARASRIIVLTGVEVPAGKIHAHIFGWAAETPQGWVGRVMTAHVATATRDLPGFAAGSTRVVPRGTANIVNGYTDGNGVRASTVCLAGILRGVVTDSTVTLTGELTHVENSLIFKPGDPIGVEGEKGAGEFTFTIRAAGKDRTIRCTGVILTS